MPYAAHKRLIASGTFADNGAAGPEIWSFSLSDASALDPEAVVNAAKPVLSDYIRSVTPQNSLAGNEVTMTLVRAEAVRPDGTVSSSYGSDVTVLGTGGTSSMPYFCTVCCTLETADTEPSGRAIRGRFYPPNTALQPHGNGVGAISPLLANSGKALVNALNTAGLSICVASKTAGLNAIVTAISSDNIIDTQRRRKNNARGTRTRVNL